MNKGKNEEENSNKSSVSANEQDNNEEEQHEEDDLEENEQEEEQNLEDKSNSSEEKEEINKENNSKEDENLEFTVGNENKDNQVDFNNQESKENQNENSFDDQHSFKPKDELFNEQGIEEREITFNENQGDISVTSPIVVFKKESLVEESGTPKNKIESFKLSNSQELKASPKVSRQLEPKKELIPIEEKSESVHGSEKENPVDSSINEKERSTLKKLSMIDPKKDVKLDRKEVKAERKYEPSDFVSDFDRQSTIRRRIETESEYNVELKNQNDFINMSRFDEASRIGFGLVTAKDEEDGKDEFEKVDFTKMQNIDTLSRIPGKPKEQISKLKYEAREINKFLFKQKIRKNYNE